MFALFCGISFSFVSDGHFGSVANSLANFPLRAYPRIRLSDRYMFIYIWFLSLFISISVYDMI